METALRTRVENVAAPESCLPLRSVPVGLAPCPSCDLLKSSICAPGQGLVTWLDSPQARTLKTRKKAQLCFWGIDANSSLSPSCPSYHPAPLCRVPAPQADGKGRLQRAPKAQDHKAEPQIKANGLG